MNPTQPTPEQAIELLSQVAAQFRGTLAEHQAIQQAISVLRDAILKPAE